MVNEQPEALRLADALDLYATGDAHQRDIEQAAAELRRLHDEVQQLKSDLSEEVLISNEMLEVKDELLAALETMRYAYASHGNHAYCQVGTEEDVLNLVDAAIAKAERTTP